MGPNEVCDPGFVGATVGLLCLAGLCASGTDHAERRGSNARGRGAQESAAMMVDVFGH